MDELFRSYFARGEHVNDRSVLLAAAERAGVPDASTVLDNPGPLEAELDAQLAGARRGARGVPLFVVDGGRLRLSGAQPEDVWEEIFEEAAERARQGRGGQPAA
mmetsp:Transcript_27744/g.92815  ORF Transcript_27744/g.92815 Transcript_27744/m.92815 type:complete len:104 (-) Transcript_27744:54-365(-)